ncbi:MAG: MFS transporter [Faecalibacterium prausnitzii]
MLFPLNNGATNVYYVLVLSLHRHLRQQVLAYIHDLRFGHGHRYAPVRRHTDPIIGALMDRTNGKFGKFRPFMVIGNLIMAVSILVLYCLTPLIPASVDGPALIRLSWLCTQSGSSAPPSRPAAPFRPDRSDNDPKQRPLFTIFSTPSALCWAWVRCSSSPHPRQKL